MKYKKSGELDIDGTLQIIVDQLQEENVLISAQLSLCLLGRSIIDDNTITCIYENELLDIHSITKYLRTTDCYPLIKNVYSEVNNNIIDINNVRNYIKSLNTLNVPDKLLLHR